MRVGGRRYAVGSSGAQLRPYHCTAINRKTGHPCRTVLIEAWAPFGALVRRRCKQCGTWATVEVAADPPEPLRAIVLD